MLAVEKLRDVDVHEARPGCEPGSRSDLNASARKIDLAGFYARPMPVGLASKAADKILHRPN